MQLQFKKPTLTVLALLGICLEFSLAQGDRAKSLPEGFVKEWKKAGAVYGGIPVNKGGSVEFKHEVDGKISGLPAFQLTDWQNGLLAKLPLPESNFGLSFYSPIKEKDLDLKALARFKHLQILQLLTHNVTDDGLKELAPLAKLQWLDCQFNKKITDAGVKHLAALKQMQTLNLPYSQVTGTGFDDLAGLEKLETVSVYGAKVTDTGMKSIAKLKNLKRLNFGFNKVTDVGLLELAACENLRALESTGNRQITNAGFQELIKKLPKLLEGD